MAIDSPWRSLAASWLLAGLASAANAGFVTINEAGMDTIFSQSSFGANAVDIRFNPVQVVHNTALLVIDANFDAELDQLGGIVGPGNTVGMFFVDSIGYCGRPTSSTVGCAFINDNVIAMNSSFAAGAFGAKLASHELGHALGLVHPTNPSDPINPAIATNLMYPTVNASSTANLTTGQVSTIFSSSLIQIDSVTHQRFISITPYQVLADVVSHVPEPGTLLMAGVGVAVVSGVARRVKRRQ